MTENVKGLIVRILSEIEEAVITDEDAPTDDIPEGYTVAGILPEELRPLHVCCMRKLEQEVELEYRCVNESVAEEDQMELRMLGREIEILFGLLNRLIEPLLPLQAKDFSVCEEWQLAWSDTDPDELLPAPHEENAEAPSHSTSLVLTADPPSPDTKIH